MTTVLLVDDHAIVREGFKRLFQSVDGYEVVGEASGLDEGLDCARRLRPDIAVIDLSLGDGESGMNLLSAITSELSDTCAVVLSMHDDPGLVLRAIDLGARGYVTKAAAADELLELLKRLMDGEIVFSSDLNMRAAGNTTSLTPRESETLRGLLSGAPPKAVAMELGISVKTLYRHRANLMEKLGVRTYADLVRVTRERGLLNMLDEPGPN